MSAPSNKTTHAQRRRLEAREGARLKLKAGQYVRRLREIADKAESVDPSQIPALRLKADIYSKLLAKCLPDLKSVEHSGEVTNRYVQEFSDAELANIAALAARGGAGASEEADGSPQPGGVH
jgi:hypothetical protein